jgi:hypothetical protein
MTAVFDTLKFSKRLKEAGFTENQAEGLAEAIKEAGGEADLATKRDIKELAMKEDIANLRTEIERMGRLIITWNVGTLIAVASLVFVILRLTGDGGS